MARRNRKQRDESQPEATAPDEGEPLAAGPPEASEPARVTPVDIQQKEFRVAFRGYNERDVDVFLDQVTEEVARLHADNKRLREEVGMHGGSGLVGADEADAIIRQARLEADRILSEARTNVAAASGAAAREAGLTPDAGLTPEEAATARLLIGAFLAREREFLQTIANLIQDHAQGVKDSAARARDEIASVPSTAPAAPPAPTASPAAAAPATSVPPPMPAATPRSEPVPVPAPAPAPARPSAPPPTPSPEAGSAPPPPAPPPRIADAPTAVRAPVGEPAPAPVRPPSTLLDAAETPRIAPAADSPTASEPILGEASPRAADREHPPPPPGSEPEDRSIQELFWGEV